GLLPGKQVCGVVEHHQLGVGDPLGDEVGVALHRGGLVLGAADDEGGGGDAGQVLACVPLGYGLAAGGVPLGGGFGDSVAQFCDLLRVGAGVVLGEPAAHDGVGQGAGALLAGQGGTVQPVLGRSGAGRGGQQREAVDAAGGVDGQPLADHAAQGDSGVVGTADTEVVHQGQDVLSQVSHGVGALGHG